MNGKNESDKMEDVMLPGFRFHPTDEELVGFYLKKTIQQRALPIELIKQVDIYKYDPWDLPNLASTGEKEWYFYCPRDRKYRNSARPNRVTGAGFWKATGTDRPIYSSDGTKCIGLKKSLVFYRGRAAKGMKTDWMMHEFRLPSIADSGPTKKLLDKNLPPNDSWAICRIFKKTNSMTHRALSHSWISPLPQDLAPDIISQDSVSALDFPTFRSINQTICKLSPFAISHGNLPNGFMFSPPELSGSTNKCTDVSSMLFNLSTDLLGDASKSSESLEYEGSQQTFNSLSMNSSQDMQGSIGTEDDDDASLRNSHSPVEVNTEWGNIRSIGFPFNMLASTPIDAWKLNMPWEPPTCPSKMSGTYSTNKCYTQ